MGVALGAQYFLVDGGTGGSLSSFLFFSAPRTNPGVRLALQGAFGLPESPLHAPPFEAGVFCADQLRSPDIREGSNPVSLSLALA